METTALVEQIKTIKKELNDDYLLTIQYLLAKKRFDELQAIAKGINNSTYFINNQTEGIHSLKLFSDLIKQTKDNKSS